MSHSNSINGSSRVGKTAVSSRTNATACIRCRQKKKRCDQKLPRCRLCEIAGVECFGYDAASRRQVPRTYVHSLEERIKYLEARLHENGSGEEDTGGTLESSTDPAVPPGSGSHSSGTTGVPGVPGSINRAEGLSLPTSNHGPAVAAKAAVNRVLACSHREAGRETSFSKIFLKELMNSRIGPQSPTHQDSEPDTQGPLSSGAIGSLDTSPVSLPSREAAEDLVKVYFQFTNLGMPLLHEPTFNRKLDLVYNMPRTIQLTKTHTTTESKIALFWVLEVFAIAILSKQRQDPARIPTWIADRYHTTAIMALHEAGLPADIDGVQALLLIGLYAYHHPTLWDVWKTVGTAVRLAIELGLHQDPRSDHFDSLTLDNMRRTFWVAYGMDRNLSIALAMPSCIADGAITAKFPSEIEDEFITADGITTGARHSTSKRITLHLFRYRQIQSEMQTALCNSPSPPYCSIDLVEWQQCMHRRIDEWLLNTPKENLSVAEKSVTDTFQLTYHTALFYLYRPSPNIPNPSDSQSVAMVHAAKNMIQLYRRFFRHHQLTIYWHAVENLSSAGIALLYGYAQSAQVRHSITFQSIESLAQTCSSVLWGMVEHFPAFQGKRDAFDIVASEVLADLKANGTSFTGELPRFGEHSNSQLEMDDSHLNLQEGLLPMGDSVSACNQQSQFPVNHDGLEETQRSVAEGGGEPDLYENFGSFPFPDLEEMPLVWEAVTDANLAFTPGWI